MVGLLPTDPFAATSAKPRQVVGSFAERTAAYSGAPRWGSLAFVVASLTPTRTVALCPT